MSILTAELQKFTLYWLDGKREVVEGSGIADAMTRAGYGGGAVRALDFHAKGECSDSVWDAKEKKWKSKRVQDALRRDAKPAAKPLLKDCPALECPICGRERKARGIRKDGSISYACPPDHVKHGSTYSWRIAVDGSLID